jgi:hypothetical protein
MPDARTPTRSLPVSKLLIQGQPVDPMGDGARARGGMGGGAGKHGRSYLQDKTARTQPSAGA